MNEKNALEELELGKAEIGRFGRVVALFSEYSETDVSFLNHRNVVRSVAYSRCYWLLLCLFYQSYDLKIRILVILTIK